MSGVILWAFFDFDAYCRRLHFVRTYLGIIFGTFVAFESEVFRVQSP